MKIDSITPCEEEGEEEEDEEEEEEEVVGKGDGDAQILSQKKKKAHNRLLEEEEEGGKKGGEERGVTLAIDQAAEWVQLDILEAMALPTTTRGSGSSSNNVLINARIVNIGETPLCGISLWIHDFHSAVEYWSLVSSSKEGEEEDGREEGGVESMDVVTLPTRNSSLAVGGSHYFGLVVEEKGLKEGERTGGYPNMVVVRASQACEVTL